MEKVRPWCGQPSDRGRLTNRTEQNGTQQRHAVHEPLKFERWTRRAVRGPSTRSGLIPVNMGLKRFNKPRFDFHVLKP